MKAFKNSNAFDGGHDPGGGSSGFQGPGAVSSGGGFHDQGYPGHQGGYDQQHGQGNQQQQQSDYQSNPKQLNSGQYHVFTTSLCKRDQKLHKRAVNSVEPVVPQYLRWSEQPILCS